MSDPETLLSRIESRLRTTPSSSLYDELLNLDLLLTSPNHFIKRSQIYERLKYYEKSEEDLTTALTKSSSSKVNTERILIQLVNLHELQEKYEEALKDSQSLYEITRQDKWLSLKDKYLNSLKQQKLKQEAGDFLMIFKANTETKPGSEWHIISLSWFERWQSYIQISSSYMPEEIPFKLTSSFIRSEHPGIIDNSDIIDFDQTSIILANPAAPHSKITLKKGKAENSDYILVPGPAFDFLCEKYNCTTDIKRYAIEINDTMYQVEVTLKLVNIASFLNSNLENNSMNFSAKDTISTLKSNYLSIKKYSGASKLWKINMQLLSIEKLLVLLKTNETVYLEGAKVLNDNLLLDDAEISEQDLLFIETPRSSGFLFTDDEKKIKDRCGFCQTSVRLSVTCKKCSTVKYCTSTCMQKHAPAHSPKCRPRNRSLLRCFCIAALDENNEDEAQVVPIDSVIRNKEGLVGLQNLGNTCFMNAAIQCLSHTNELTEVFLSKKYVDLVNKTNPLGTNGKLVQAYADLLETLWKGVSASTAPWKMKKTIGAYASQFVGYQQHDAQELLGFMLDRIHEDLNQVKKKPYFEDSDLNGKSDEEKAKESWKRHVLRNQSVIVDLMHGQYKSSVFCPRCKQESITFDPFNSITLPLPQSQDKTLSFYYIFYDSEKVPFNLVVEYSKTLTIETLRKEVSRLLEVPQNSFTFACILNDMIKEYLKDSRTIDSLKNFTIFAYEFKEIEDFETLELQVSIEKNKSKATSYSRIINITKGSSFKDLHYEIFSKFKKFLPKLNQKLKIQDLYSEFLENPAYEVQFVSNKEKTCQFCKERTCKGCPLPFSNEKISKIFPSQTIVIEITWKSNYSSLGANLTDMNRCIEHDSVSEVLQKNKKIPVKLEECFDLFRVPERLEKENAWYCPTCKDHVLATKKLEIYKVPPILIIHIKRFRVNGHVKEKLYNPVVYPETGLDIENWVIGKHDGQLYDLYAVCNHYGNLSGGHYTASCYSTLNKKWFDFKDAQVVLNTDMNHSASAYVLFYRARK